MKIAKRIGLRVSLLTVLLVGALLLAACGRSFREAPPTATVSPTATPVPPTATPEPDVAIAAKVPTPEVSIPEDFDPILDESLEYSLALPGGWTVVDLRGDSFQRMADTFGMADQLAPLNVFLDSPQGDAVGVVAATDLAGVLFGGLPTLLNVSVVDAPGATSQSVTAALEDAISANGALLGDVTIGAVETTTVNNLPAVTADAVANLSSVGMETELYAKVVGLIANEKVYVLTLATEAGNQNKKEATFNEIIGTFRPE